VPLRSLRHAPPAELARRVRRRVLLHGVRHRRLLDDAHVHREARLAEALVAHEILVVARRLVALVATGGRGERRGVRVAVGGAERVRRERASRRRRALAWGPALPLAQQARRICMGATLLSVKSGRCVTQRVLLKWSSQNTLIGPASTADTETVAAT
jgi:hypothetical protein